MMLATGGFLVCLALLALAALGPIFRGSDPPEWTQRRWVGEVVTVAIVCALAIGLGYLGAGAINAAQGSVDYLDLALLAAVLLVTVALWRQWRRRRARLGSGAALRVAVAPATAAPGLGQAVAAERLTPIQAPPPHRAA